MNKINFQEKKHTSFSLLIKLIMNGKIHIIKEDEETHCYSRDIAIFCFVVCVMWILPVGIILAIIFSVNPPPGNHLRN